MTKNYACCIGALRCYGHICGLWTQQVTETRNVGIQIFFTSHLTGYRKISLDVGGDSESLQSGTISRYYLDITPQ